MTASLQDSVVDDAVADLGGAHRRWVLPLLRALVSAGGESSPIEAERAVRKILGSNVTDLQWAHVIRGNYVRWTRHHLNKLGLVAGKPGTWALTDLGRGYYARHSSDSLEPMDSIPEADPDEAGRIEAPLETVQATAQAAFELPLLKLLEAGVKTKQELLDGLGESLKSREVLLPGDHRTTPRGLPVWRYRASWGLTALKNNGEARNPDTARWEITETGRERLKKNEVWDFAAYRNSHASVRAAAVNVAPSPTHISQSSPPAKGDLSAWNALASVVGEKLFANLSQRLRPDLGPTPNLAGRPIARNVVLYGPPGTGKTFVALRVAEALTGEHDAEEADRWRIVQFHPSYSYEDFVQGLRPDLELRSLRYRMSRGPLLQICEAAEQDPDSFYVLIIDEINRGDPARIFGELLFALEYRGRSVDLAAGGQLSVPPNLIVVGTMNSADRSVALVDYALRRRFGFARMDPDPAVVLAHAPGSIGPVGAAVLEAFNDWLRAALDADHTLGHSFFLSSALPTDSRTAMDRIWEMDLAPLLEEYFFGAEERLKEALQKWSALVKQALREAQEGDDPSDVSA